MSVRPLLPSVKDLENGYIKVSTPVTEGEEFYIIFDDVVKHIKILKISDEKIFYKYLNDIDGRLRDMNSEEWDEIFNTFLTRPILSRIRPIRPSGGTKRRRNKNLRKTRKTKLRKTRYGNLNRK